MILTWAERCEYWNDGEIVTNAMIQKMMQEEIDELREALKCASGNILINKEVKD